MGTLAQFCPLLQTPVHASGTRHSRRTLSGRGSGRRSRRVTFCAAFLVTLAVPTPTLAPGPRGRFQIPHMFRAAMVRPTGTQSTVNTLPREHGAYVDGRTRGEARGAQPQGLGSTTASTRFVAFTTCTSASQQTSRGRPTTRCTVVRDSNRTRQESPDGGS
jgi:hypothetical protein